MAKLLVDITAHGFGHLAQTAPIVRATCDKCPGLDVVVRTGLPEEVVAGRIAAPIRVVSSDMDFGMVMRSPLEVDRLASYDRYAALHENYDAVVAELSAWLAGERFDVVLSNVSYLVIAAAHAARIPAIAVSSLDWLSVFRHYCGDFERTESIVAQIRESYRKARAICRLSPGLPMADLDTTQIPGIIASVGTPRRAELLNRFPRKPGARIIVFAFGGMTVGDPLPHSTNTRGDLLFGPDAWGGTGSWIAASASGIPFLDLIASADVIVTKPGYGIVTEVAAAGRPILLLSRGDWPEEPYLFDWLRRFVRCDYLPPRMDTVNLAAIVSWLDSEAEGAPRDKLQTGAEWIVSAKVTQFLEPRSR